MANPQAPINYKAHRGEEIGLNIAIASVSTIAVALRLAARYKTKVKLWWDDYLIIFALLLIYGGISVGIWAANQGGYGFPLLQIPLPLIEANLKLLYWSGIILVLTLTCIKFSILALYYRIFSSKTFQFWVKIVAATCAAWGISSFFVVLLKCLPIETSWKPLKILLHQGQCVNFIVWFMIVESINCLQDLIIVLMPVGVIRKLQLPLKQKIWLCFVFALGGFVCVTSIVRIRYTYNPSIQISAWVESGKWALIQVASAIVCACAPTYRPLLPKTLISSTVFSSWYSRLKGSQHTQSSTSTNTAHATNNTTAVNTTQISTIQEDKTFDVYGYRPHVSTTIGHSHSDISSRDHGIDRDRSREEMDVGMIQVHKTFEIVTVDR